MLEKVGPVAYRIALRLELDKSHNVFHVSMLKRYHPGPSHILDFQSLDLREDLTYKEYPIRILGQRVKELKSNTIPLVKVLWSHHGTKEATWEMEESICKQHPHLFCNSSYL